MNIMTTAELKTHIVENIFQIDDDELLNDINEVLKLKNSEPKKVILQPWQRKKIEKSLKQIENGEYKTSEEVFREIEEWLKK